MTSATDTAGTGGAPAGLPGVPGHTWSDVWRTVVLAPVAWRTWASYAHLMTGCLLGLSALLVLPVVVLVAVAPPLALLLAALTAAVLVGCTGWFTGWQRRRFAALLGVRLAPFPGREAVPRRRWVIFTAMSAGTWRQLAYHLTTGLVSFAGVVAWVFCWALGAVLVTLPASAVLLPHRGSAAAHLNPVGFLLLSAVGMGLFLLAPWLARGTVALDVAMAGALLQPSGREELARQVAALSASRAGAVDAADAERRRIERDLHDGAQQRLTSLALNLGMARSTLAPDAPPETRRAIEEAHDEAKQALAELRGFVRGLHPAVLDERGLDAALSGIVARSPVPTSLRVMIAQRPPRTLEAVAYFVVSEALTNVAKHSGATSASVRVTSDAQRLVVEVSDDGHGGATVGAGSGLTGLINRVAAVDGTLAVTSPAGGPTVLRAELPCAS